MGERQSRAALYSDIFLGLLVLSYQNYLSKFTFDIEPFSFTKSKNISNFKHTDTIQSQIRDCDL